MIHIHTDELLAAVSSLRAANGQVDNAAQHLLQITNHNDWTCKERSAMNANAEKLRTEIKRLQQDTERYLHAASNAADAFVAEENGVKALFPGVDAIISKLLNIGGTAPHEGSSGIAHGGTGRRLRDHIGLGELTTGDLSETIRKWSRPVIISGDVDLTRYLKPMIMGSADLVTPGIIAFSSLDL